MHNRPYIYRVKYEIYMRSNGQLQHRQEPFCDVVKWSSSKKRRSRFLDLVAAVTTASMGVSPPCCMTFSEQLNAVSHAYATSTSGL